MSPSLPQILIVLVILLVFFGPSRLPGLGKSLGEAIRGFKSAMDDLNNPDDSNNKKTNERAHSQALNDAPPAQPARSEAAQPEPVQAEPTGNKDKNGQNS